MATHLILEIQTGPALEIGDSWRKVFAANGGRIGRSLDCEWVLSNRYISRHHASIACVKGVFYIESVGANGVALNEPRQRVARRVRRALRDGDRIFLDKYEIKVSVTDDSREPICGDDATPLQMRDWEGWEPAPDNVVDFPLLTDAARAKSPLVAAAGSAALTLPRDLSETGLTNPVPLLDLEQPVLRQLALEPPAAADPGVTPAMGALTFDSQSFFKGLGLTAAAIPADKAFMLGQVVRTVVEALMDVLRDRTGFRAQLPLPGSRPEASSRTPLLLDVVEAEGIAALLRAAEGPGAPLEALEDALDDLRFHQLAMLAGMHAAFQRMTSWFDPVKLIEQCDRGHPAGLARLGAKRRYWDRYVSVFEQAVVSADGDLRRRFGEEFSAAYERQLADLKSSRVRAASGG
jgi:type VI secretion system protein ImpI